MKKSKSKSRDKKASSKKAKKPASKIFKPKPVSKKQKKSKPQAKPAVKLLKIKKGKPKEAERVINKATARPAKKQKPQKLKKKPAPPARAIPAKLVAPNPKPIPKAKAKLPKKGITLPIKKSANVSAKKLVNAPIKKSAIAPIKKPAIAPVKKPVIAPKPLKKAGQKKSKRVKEVLTPKQPQAISRADFKSSRRSALRADVGSKTRPTAKTLENNSRKSEPRVVAKPVPRPKPKKVAVKRKSAPAPQIPAEASGPSSLADRIRKALGASAPKTSSKSGVSKKQTKKSPVNRGRAAANAKRSRRESLASAAAELAGKNAAVTKPEPGAPSLSPLAARIHDAMRQPHRPADSELRTPSAPVVQSIPQSASVVAPPVTAPTRADIPSPPISTPSPIAPLVTPLPPVQQLPIEAIIQVEPVVIPVPQPSIPMPTKPSRDWAFGAEPTRLVLLVRDPTTLFAYWDVSSEDVTQHKLEPRNPRLEIRLEEIAPSSAKRAQEKHEVVGTAEAIHGKIYLTLPSAGRTWQAILGLTRGKRFTELCRSNVVTSPRDHIVPGNPASSAVAATTTPFESNVNQILRLSGASPFTLGNEPAGTHQLLRTDTMGSSEQSGKSSRTAE